MLLLCLISIGVALAFMPSWKVIGGLNVVLFVCIVWASVAAGQSWLLGLGSAVLYLFALSGSFVAASLVLDHAIDRKHAASSSSADQASHLAWNGNGDEPRPGSKHSSR